MSTHTNDASSPLAASDDGVPESTVIEPANVSLRQFRNFRTCPRFYAHDKGLITLDNGDLLKNLRSLPALVGMTVHAAAAETMAAFCTGERPDAEPTVSMIGETGWVVELMNQWAEIFWVIA